VTHRRNRALEKVIACVALVLTGLSAIPASAGAKTIRPEVTEVGAPPAVGALFTVTKKGELSTHFCTASVVDSPAGDLILTAAHCLVGKSPSGVAFVPQYHDGEAPLGVWHIARFVTDKAWTTTQDPDDDFAFLVVRQSAAGSTLQAVTGGEQLGFDRPAGQLLTVVGYPNARNTPISCQSVLRLASKTQLRFDCEGYSAGTSGSALTVDLDAKTGLGTVVGVIGGYEQGGYTSSVSYAARFQGHTAALYAAATLA
jgi:V8-like Glu-specific endopeptidase